MTATVGGGLSFGSQAGAEESMARWELTVEQEKNHRRRKQVAGCLKRRFLTKDKDMPHGQNR
jgi:hypothetical protein